MLRLRKRRSCAKYLANNFSGYIPRSRAERNEGKRLIKLRIHLRRPRFSSRVAPIVFKQHVHIHTRRVSFIFDRALFALLFVLVRARVGRGKTKRKREKKKKKKIKRVRGNRTAGSRQPLRVVYILNRLHTTYLGGVHVAPNRFTLSCTVMSSCSYLSLDIFDFYSPSIPFIRPLEPRRPLRL